jgi:hypothetical protein
MKLREAAKHIGCHPRHIRTLIYRKLIKVKKVVLKNVDGKVFGFSYEITIAEAERVRNTKRPLTKGGWKRGKKRKVN